MLSIWIYESSNVINAYGTVWPEILDLSLSDMCVCAWGTRSCHLDQRKSGCITESNSRSPVLFHIKIVGTYECSYPKGMFFLWYELWVVALPEWHCLNYPGKRPQTACRKELKKNWNRRRRSVHRGKRCAKVRIQRQDLFSESLQSSKGLVWFRAAIGGRSCCAGSLCKAICTRCL